MTTFKSSVEVPAECEVIAMKRTRKTAGSALILVMISGIFLIILVGAAYTYFKTSGDTQAWAVEKIQARYAAESGANLAVHMIMGGADVPQGGEPDWFMGGEFSWFTLPDPLGEVKVVVDPNNNNDQVSVANAYEVRSVGRVSGHGGYFSYGVRTAMMPENVARFSVFMDDPSTDGYYGDGYKFDGPFYANGPVCVYSSSIGTTNDPFFYSFTNTASYYIYGQSGAGVHATTPQIGNLQMQPYNRLRMGAPWFELNAEPIPFGSGELEWTSVRNAAQSGGLYLTGTDVGNDMRILIRHDTLMVRLSAAAPVVKYPMAGYDKLAVWLDLVPGQTVYLRSYGILEEDGLSIPLSIGTLGNIALAGNLYYQNSDPLDPNNEIMLGLMSVNGNLLIAHPRNNVNWDQGFSVSTNQSIEVDAVLLSLDGVLQSQIKTGPFDSRGFLFPSPGGDLTIVGGYMIQEEGFTSTTTTGHDIQVFFDPRLMTMHPPYFPNNGRWHTLYWEQDPELRPNSEVMLFDRW
ncbi:MAG: hypothetical protein R6V62_03935 [Candidatus Fermentibacteraceae bacterium]